jgi:hypothetical protein
VWDVWGSPAPSPDPARVAPFTDADARRISALPAAEQVEEVRKELMRRNAKFDGKLTPTIADGVVVGLAFLTDNVTDVSPVRVLSHLRTLRMKGSRIGKGSLADLSPLAGMGVTDLNFDYNRVGDLSPLKGLKLTRLQCWNNPVVNLEPLQGMPLAYLDLWGWRGSYLTALQGMPLKGLNCGGLRVALFNSGQDAGDFIHGCHR